MNTMPDNKAPLKNYNDLPAELMQATPKRKSRLLVVLLLLIPVLSVIAVSTYWYYNVLDRDYDYSKVAKQVSFHVYKSTFPPRNFVPLRKYKIITSEKTNKQFVSIIYASPASKHLPGIIAIQQRGVTVDFDLYQGIIESVKNPEEYAFEQMDFSLSKNNLAYIYEKPDRTMILYYVTHDNVFISISCGGLDPSISREEILNIATNLK